MGVEGPYATKVWPRGRAAEQFKALAALQLQPRRGGGGGGEVPAGRTAVPAGVNYTQNERKRVQGGLDPTGSEGFGRRHVGVAGQGQVS